MKKLFNQNENQLLELVGFFWLGLLFLGIILALFGIFYKSIIALYLILGGIFLIYAVWHQVKKIRLGFYSWIIAIISISFIVFLSNFTAPSIFSGRDQGSFSEAAIRLAQNHQLQFSFPAEQEFFKIYGPGKALDFPGFNYTKSGQLITQFPVGYVSWLAIFYSFFSLNGLIIANGVTFFIFLLSFYLIARNYLKPVPAFIGLLLVLTSFAFSWFFKFTLSENLAMALIWFGILEIMKYFSNYKNIHLAAALFSFYLLAFTRIEALAFVAILLLILFFKNRVSADFNNSVKKFVLIALPFLLIYFISLYINRDFYITFFKGLINSVTDYKQSGGQVTPIPVVWVFRVFILYGLTAYLILGIVGIIYLHRKKINILLPFLILLPSFIYLIYPGITLDQPWMLRRYVFSVIPVLILYSLCFLYYFFANRKSLFYLFSVLLIISSLTLSSMYFIFSENENLLPQVEKMSQNFQSSDLVLVDREATGSGFSMMSGPLNFLYGKQAVYFLNPNDLDKINKSRFSHIYFIIPDKNIDFYRDSGIMDRLTLKSEYEIDNDYFNEAETKSTTDLPPIFNDTVRGGIYLLKS